jgi:signal transduction histidine kinase
MLTQAVSDRCSLPIRSTWNGRLWPLEPLSSVGEAVAHICHDLRNPLTAILANAEFLAQRGMNKTQRNEIYLEIRQTVDSMDDLISSLLEFSKGNGTLRLAPESIVDTVGRAIRLASVRREFRHISIEHCHSGLGIGWFDSNRIERVIANLVLNACEAVSPDTGRVVITTAASRTRLQVSVRDNGPGVPPLIRNSVFNPFVSAGKAGGSGLGLAIANKIVEDHGGEIWLDESDENGTLFKITIPLSVPVPKIAVPLAARS